MAPSIRLDVMTGDLMGPIDEVVLTEYKTRFLETLARRPRITITRAIMMDSVYRDRLDVDRPTSDTLSVLLSTVRLALITVAAEYDAIITCWGEGWQLNVPIKLIEPTQVRCPLCRCLYMAPGDDAEQRT